MAKQIVPRPELPRLPAWVRKMCNNRGQFAFHAIVRLPIGVDDAGPVYYEMMYGCMNPIARALLKLNVAQSPIDVTISLEDAMSDHWEFDIAMSDAFEFSSGEHMCSWLEEELYVLP